jgi:nucleotidyltransferase/DNA polymerase involved in DNA repair
MDAFFASIEQRDNPAFRGKPVIVGALPGNRGVVCAASYEARVFGVHSAQPISRAYSLCPQGVFVPPRMSAYSQTSKEIMAILGSFSPVIEQVSIDEAFLDISGTQRLWGEPLETARIIARAVFDKQRLSVSIGIAPNKYLAKIASDLHKPNGITKTPFDEKEIEAWLSVLPVGKIMGVGEKTVEIFHALELRTIGDVQQRPLSFLTQRFGKYGELLYRLCRGIDDRQVESISEAKSISREYTFDKDTGNHDHWKKTLLELSDDVARQARKKGLRGAVAVLIYRASDFTKHTRRVTLSKPIDSASILYKEALSLLENAGLHGKLLRLIGVGLTGFSEAQQTELFETDNREKNREASEKAMDAIVQKFGKNSLVRGTHIGNTYLGQ